MYTFEGLIGGPGSVIQIDECKIGTRKYNRLVEGKWIIGMIDEHTGQFRLEICPENKRNAMTLLPLIQKHVAGGSVIISDCWNAYNNLQNLGYNHLRVNHSYNFVDPNTLANTQTIEASWRPLRRALTKGGSDRDLMGDYLCEYFWRRHYKRINTDMFSQFLKDISNLYNEFDQ